VACGLVSRRAAVNTPTYRSRIGTIMRGPIGLVAVVLAGFLLSYALRAFTPIGVTLPNSPTVADAQRDPVAPRM
jgi:hypothetical protein